MGANALFRGRGSIRTIMLNNDSTLELTQRNFKQNFINLLKNSPKNAKSREKTRQGSRVDESFIISDMYNLKIQLHAQQGLDPPPNLCINFETLLLIVRILYSSDQFNFNFDLEYWGPMEIANNYERTSTRSVSLFKLIRLAGELLPPNLFVPFIKMLTGLSSYQQKQGPGVSGSTTLSCDHFFESLNRYYLTLRQEQHPTTDTDYRLLNRSISTQEVASLQPVLAVVQAVAKHDEVARIALCEHSSWQPLTIFLGLIGCSVAIHLKTELLLTLAALGKCEDTAMQSWINLEAKQIITTIPSTTEFAVRSIESEIEQIESRNGTYPLTLVLLEFLYPTNLRAATRKPGLDPYLTFVVETVFLRFYRLILHIMCSSR